MTTGIRLVPLRCQKCATNLYVPPQSAVLYCPGCGTGFEVTPKEELRSVPIYFAQSSPDSKTFLPFWVFDARLDLMQREAKSAWFGNPNGLVELFKKRGALRFYAPAFLQDVDSDEPRGLQLTYQQPEFKYIASMPQIPTVAVSSEDARKIAEHLFLTSEIEQKDTLRSLKYRLDLETQFLLILAV